MSVTDTRPVQASTGRPPVTSTPGLVELAQYAIERNAELKRTSPEYLRIVAALEHGDRCAKCEHVFLDTEMAYRDTIETPMRAIFGAPIDIDCLVCRDCATEPDSRWRWTSTTSCPVCTRLVRYATEHSRTGACSRRCARSLEAQRKREVRAEARRWRAHARCATCGVPFKPTRSDARFCSGACRQSAYRARTQGK